MVQHETMHIFGAVDQYGDQTTLFSYPENLAGYLYASNSNSERNSGKGFFGGAGEGQEDLMIRGWTIGVYTRGQIGWRDSDGDGVLDPQDTFPDIISLTRSTTYPYAYTGKAIDKPLRYCDPSYHYGYYLRGGDISINSIKNVEYRVNGGAWCGASSLDGSFDKGEEQFLFILPYLSERNYKVEVRATNSVGNVEVSYAKDEFSIPKNAITNTTPFAAFSVTPPEGSMDTNFVFDASESSDIENKPSELKVRWDFENDGIWDTSYSDAKVTSFRYSTVGTKVVKLQVKDISGLTGMVTKQIEVASFNISPRAFFTVTPENQHGAYETFPVKLDVAGSYDGENDLKDLKVRWDFEDDGIWDTEYSNELALEHIYKLPNSFPLTKVDLVNHIENMCVSGNYVYIANLSKGLVIVDITNPKAPVLAGSYQIVNGAYGICVSGKFAYVYSQSPDYNLSIFDISNPKNPTLVGKYDTGTRTIASNNICILGKYVYIFGAKNTLDGFEVIKTDLRLDIVDVSNPYLPVLTGRYTMPIEPPPQEIKVGKLFIAGNRAFVVHDYLGNGFQIIDISNPKDPSLIGSYKPLRGQITGMVVLQNNNMYLSNNKMGLQIVNIENIKAPIEVGSYGKLGIANGIDIAGGYAYVVDDKEGLEIFDIFSNLQQPVLIAYSAIPGLFAAMEVHVSEKYVFVNAFQHFFMIDIQGNGTIAPVSKHWRIKLEVLDKNGNKSYATRDVWTNTYNHPPEPKIQKDNETTFTILGNDPDINTSWDGLLEYRWDFNNDGIWDTAFFEGSNKLTVKPEYYGSTVIGEVRDRFGATGRVTLVFSAPTNLTAQALSSRNVKLTWKDNSSEEISFKIERSISPSGPWTQVGAVSANITTYTDSSAVPNTTYYYRVYAYPVTGISMHSDVVSVKTLTFPAPTTLTAQALSSRNVKLTWKDNSTEEEYFVIERGPSSSGPWTYLKPVAENTTTYTDTSAAPNTTYCYRVYAYCAGFIAYSNVVSVKTLVLSAPTNLTAQALSSSQIKLEWKDNSNEEDGFRIERSLSSNGPWMYVGLVGTNVTTVTHWYLTPNMTYYYRVYAYHSTGYSAYSNVASAKTPGIVVQTPWKTNANGTLATNVAWNYTMGYQFTPLKDGQITKLGGFYNGTKTVYLWDSTGKLLSSASVTSANNWNYTAISPVTVKAGQTYTVAVYLNGSGGSYRSSIASLPRTYSNIRIERSCYRSGNGYPTTLTSTTMYGQADIEYKAN